MQELQRGGNTNLPGGAKPLEIRVTWSPEKPGGVEADASAFMLTADGKVRNDSDFIFYNQPASPEGSLTLAPRPGDTRFALALDKVPAAIEKIAFTVTLHGRASFESTQRCRLEVTGIAGFTLETAGMREAAVIMAEIYRRQGQWKIRAVGQGFEGGLAPLATHYGVDVGDDGSSDQAPAPTPTPAPTPAPSPTPAANSGRVKLEKRLVDLEKKDPQLVSLVKKVQVSLDKRQILRDQAKVALVLDISASMTNLFKSGKIDALVQRIMALGYRFDDDGAIDVFLFGKEAHDYGEVTVDTYRGFVREMQRAYDLEMSTNYGKVMALVRRNYDREIRSRNVPIYVMFVTDGNTVDEARAEQEIRDAAAEPLFWQFMAIGAPPKKGKKKGGFFSRLLGSDFSFLEKLDTMEGRVIDNANFFLVQDPTDPSDEELFDMLMGEYPDWLKAAEAANILV